MTAMKRFNDLLIAVVLATLVVLVGCNVHKEENASGGKNASVDTPFGSMKVETNNVSPKDAGLQAYPGARLVPKENDKGDSDANVNIDTPWFGLKVVALKYESDDAPEKIWNFYKKDMAQYGRVLECKPGSPDLNIQAKDKDEISCKDTGQVQVKSGHSKIQMDDSYNMQLKAGAPGRLHVVGIKPSGSGSKFSLVYVVTRGSRESI
jgi:hypothetical protein